MTSYCHPNKNIKKSSVTKFKSTGSNIDANHYGNTTLHSVQQENISCLILQYSFSSPALIHCHKTKHLSNQDKVTMRHIINVTSEHSFSLYSVTLCVVSAQFSTNFALWYSKNSWRLFNIFSPWSLPALSNLAVPTEFHSESIYWYNTLFNSNEWQPHDKLLHSLTINNQSMFPQSCNRNALNVFKWFKMKTSEQHFYSCKHEVIHGKIWQIQWISKHSYPWFTNNCFFENDV
jgi:hypothetical protein